MSPTDSPTAEPAAFRFLQLRGADAADFLHGQLTCDVTGLPEGRWTWAGYCSAKGRLQAVGRLARIVDGWVWQLPGAEIEAVAAQLRRFVLRAKVQISPGAVDEAAVRIRGAGALASVAARGTVALDPGAAASCDGLVVLATAPGELLVQGDGGRLRQWLGSLEAECPDLLIAPAAPAEDIEAGLPWLAAPTRDAFIPQMVDLDRLGGVSFQKGCYPGQEIVARTQYLGRVKRRLHLAFTTALPAPGAAVQTADAGEPAGTVLQARRLDTDRSVVLAVLDESLAASVPLRLATGDPLADVRLCRPD